jgi:hypothetical protein
MKEREASALRDFATFPLVPKQMALEEDPPLLVPQLILEDVKNHVLIMHDLGISGTLPDALETFRIPPSALADAPMDKVVPHFEGIGYDLGAYFAFLHSSSVKEPLRKRGYEFKVLLQFGIAPTIQANIEKYLRMFDIRDGHDLGQRAAEDYYAKLDGEFEVFTGNISLGSILIDDPVLAESRKGLVDWECSGWGRGINGEMAHLFAEMFMYLTAPRRTKAIRSVVTALMRGMGSGYRERSQAEGSTLVMARGKTLKEFGGQKRRLPPKVARALRSLYIRTGTELMYMAFNLPRSCLCCKPGETKDCEWVKKTVQLGAVLLEFAGRNEHDFQSSNNWKRVSDASRTHSWLLDLVFDV